MTRPVVFLDRDGTLNEDVGYLHAHDQLALFPWTIDAVRLLNRSGRAVVVLTNQSGIGRGIIAEGFVETLHAELEQRIRAGGGLIDGWYYCPHHRDALIEAYRCDCPCRKPGTGMAELAARDLGLDLTRAWMVGDKWSDVGLGHAVGGRSILLRTGSGAECEREGPPGRPADAVCDNLMAAVSVILAE